MSKKRKSIKKAGKPKKAAKVFRKKDPHLKREQEKYENPVPSREYIMAYLGDYGRPATKSQLMQALKVSGEEREIAFSRRLKAMMREGQLFINRRGLYALVDRMALIKGYVIGHRDGFGFVSSEDEPDDIYLSPYQMRNVFPGDVVLVRLIPGTRKKREGAIVEVIERKTQQMTGRYFVESGIGFVEANKKNNTQEVLIPEDAKGTAKPGQFVVAEITRQPTTRQQATGKIVEVLGDHMAPGLEIDVVIRSFDLPHRWPEEVQDEVSDLHEEKIDPRAGRGRVDLRDLPLVTIDGIDAKDFDDAVYCEPRNGDGWRLIVAIADVTHYVKPGSALDVEAQQRGNSVYFPGRVIPMLPEVLSNGLCSLRPHVDRLAMVCEMNLDSQGKLTRSKFYEAIIQSHARCTYDEVAAIVSGEKTKKHMALQSHLKNLYKLFTVLHKRRAQRGAIEFETVETRIEFGKSRKIKRIVPVFRNDAHRMIEECMLLANVCAAKFIHKHKLPTLYRVHEPPKATKLEAFRDTLKGMGLRMSGGDHPSPRDYTNLLKRIKGREDERFLQTVCLRSMSQAVYIPQNKGHFGLAYDMYAHFTSPIRRYPDVLVHRAIKHIIRENKKFRYDNKKMKLLGEQCSSTERRADEATREVELWLKCEYMLKKVGKTFDGHITGVTNFGLFIELDDIFVEGLCHISALPSDYYDFDPVHHRLIARAGGDIYQLGEPVTVRVARVDLDQREIDFDIVE